MFKFEFNKDKIERLEKQLEYSRYEARKAYERLSEYQNHAYSKPTINNLLDLISRDLMDNHQKHFPSAPWDVIVLNRDKYIQYLNDVDKKPSAD